MQEPDKLHIAMKLMQILLHVLPKTQFIDLE